VPIPVLSLDPGTVFLLPRPPLFQKLIEFPFARECVSAFEVIWGWILHQLISALPVPGLLALLQVEFSDKVLTGVLEVGDQLAAEGTPQLPTLQQSEAMPDLVFRLVLGPILNLPRPGLLQKLPEIALAHLVGNREFVRFDRKLLSLGRRGHFQFLLVGNAGKVLARPPLFRDWLVAEIAPQLPRCEPPKPVSKPVRALELLPIGPLVAPALV